MKQFDNLKTVFAAIGEEYARAEDKHPRPFASGHEGYGVILEELDEAWEEIKHNETKKARDELVQVAAVVVRFLLEVPNA